MGNQLPATQRRAQEVEAYQANMLADVERHKADLERFLVPLKVDYEFFVAGLRVFLVKQARDNPDFFLKLTDTGSFIESLLRIAMNGLVPDGKEAAIAVYAGVAQAMFMRDGFVKVLWRTGMVKSINDQVVTEGEYTTGRFDYEEGDQGFIQHKLDLLRKDTDPVVAAYCIIELVGGGVMREVVPKDELDKMAKMSKSPARQAWRHQMARKAALRRIMGKMPRDKAIVQLLTDDEAAYDLSKANAPAEDAPDHKTLFGGKPIRQRKAKAAPPEPLAIEQGADVVMNVMGAEQVAEYLDDNPDLVADALDRARQQEHDGDVASREAETEGVEGSVDTPFVLTAIIKRQNGPQHYPPEQAEFWYGDISDKLKRLDEPAAKHAFWNANRGYIEEAGRNGHGTHAMKLVALARDLGLTGDAARG
jgi:phage RecT family recombinase